MPNNGSASTTASPEEIARFSALAEAWWDPDGEFKPLHRLNPTRIRFIRDRVARHFRRDPHAPRPLDGLTLLDIGCGGGLLSEPMTRLGARVTGIDAGERIIGVARVHADQLGLDIDYRCGSPEHLSAAGEAPYDVVLNMEVVEHVTDVRLYFSACSKLLKPGGVMILSTINRSLKALALAKIGAEYVLRWLPAGTHDWRKFVRPSELARELRASGVEVVEFKGMSYDPLGGSWRLTDDLSVNYLACARRSGPTSRKP